MSTADTKHEATVNTQPSDDGWRWFASTDEEWMPYGPRLTREQVIADAESGCAGEFLADDGLWKLAFQIWEARQDPLRLADWFGADRALERAEEQLYDSDRVSPDFEDGPFFDATPEQEADLTERLKRACDEWQVAHGLVFTCQTFSATRRSERVVLPHPLGAKP